jgi:hypothetical protein
VVALGQGVRLAVDGTEPDLIMDIMETELSFIEERHKEGWRLVQTLGRNWAVFAAIAVALVLITSGPGGLSTMELVRQAACPALQGLLLAALPDTPRAQVLERLRVGPDGSATGSVQRGDFDVAHFLSMPDASIQVFLRAVDQHDLVVGLKGASAELREIFLRNMSQRVRAFITEEIGCCHADQVTILETQARIVMQVHSMAAKGQLELPGRD